VRISKRTIWDKVQVGAMCQIRTLEQRQLCGIPNQPAVTRRGAADSCPLDQRDEEMGIMKGWVRGLAELETTAL